MVIFIVQFELVVHYWQSFLRLTSGNIVHFKISCLAPIWDRLRVMQLLQMSWSVNLVTSFYNYVGYGHYRVLVDSKIEELSGGGGEWRRR